MNTKGINDRLIDFISLHNITIPPIEPTLPNIFPLWCIPNTELNT